MQKQSPTTEQTNKNQAMINDYAAKLMGMGKKKVVATVIKLTVQIFEMELHIARLKKYAQHKKDCDIIFFPEDGKCTCGFGEKPEDKKDLKKG